MILSAKEIEFRYSSRTILDKVDRKPHIKWEATTSDLALVQEVLARTGLEEVALRCLDEPTSNLNLKNQIEVLRT